MTLVEALEASPFDCAILHNIPGNCIITKSKLLGHQFGVGMKEPMPTMLYRLAENNQWLPAIAKAPLVENYERFLESQKPE